MASETGPGSSFTPRTSLATQNVIRIRETLLGKIAYRFGHVLHEENGGYDVASNEDQVVPLFNVCESFGAWGGVDDCAYEVGTEGNSEAFASDCCREYLGAELGEGGVRSRYGAHDEH